MANAVYDVFLTSMLTGTYNYDSGGSTFRVGINSTTTDYNATHTNMTSLSNMVDFATGQGTGTAALVNETNVIGTGTFDSTSNPTIEPTTNPATCKSLVIYFESGTDVPLLWFDTGSGLGATGTTTEGGSMQIVWSASGIFTLA